MSQASNTEPALDTLLVDHSSRSSITYAEHPATRSKVLGQPNEKHGAEQSPSTIALHVEEEFERYGGNNIYDPSPRTPRSESRVPSSGMKDPKLVDWNGPEDPENPQNWSKKYKWLITLACIVMTMNVCVFLILLIFPLY